MSDDFVRPQSRHNSNCVNRVAFLEEIFQEFVEISVHSILYHRQVYPEGTFKRKRKYRVPIHICAHPEVKDYIRRTVKSLGARLVGGSVNNVILLLYAGKKSCERRVVEEFRFRFRIDANGSSTSSELTLREIGLDQIEESLRTFLLRLPSLKSFLKPLRGGSADCGFEIEIEANSLLAEELENPSRLDQLFWVHPPPPREDAESGFPIHNDSRNKKSRPATVVVPVGTFKSEAPWAFSVVSYVKEYRARKEESIQLDDEDDDDDDDFDADEIIDRYFASSVEKSAAAVQGANRNSESVSAPIKEEISPANKSLGAGLAERENSEDEELSGSTTDELFLDEGRTERQKGRTERRVPKTFDRSKVKGASKREFAADFVNDQLQSTETSLARTKAFPQLKTRALQPTTTSYHHSATTPPPSNLPNPNSAPSGSFNNGNDDDDKNDDEVAEDEEIILATPPGRKKQKFSFRETSRELDESDIRK